LEGVVLEQQNKPTHMPATQNVIPETVQDLERQLAAANRYRRNLLHGVVMTSGDEVSKLVKILIDNAAPETLREIERKFEVGV
jgi:hypothetical protein